MLASFSSSPNETVSSWGISPPPDDYRAHQGLKKIASGLGIQVEEVKESSHQHSDILATTRPLQVSLPVNEAILELMKPLWQAPLSLPPFSEKDQMLILCPVPPPQDCLVESVASGRE